MARRSSKTPSGRGAAGTSSGADVEERILDIDVVDEMQLIP